MKSEFFLSKLPPITDVPIVNFMTTLEEIDNEYNKTFPLWLTIIITVGSTLVAVPLVFLLIHLKYAEEYSQYGTWCKIRKPKKQSSIKITLVNSTTKPRVNVRIQKSL